MAEPSPGPARGPAFGRLGAGWGAVLLFAFVVALLAGRLAAGDDPGLLAREAAVPPRPRRILVRRFEIRRIVHHLPPSEPIRNATSATTSAGGGPEWSSPAVTRVS
jgi:hypothetical protein